GQPALTAVSSAADPNSTPDGNVQPPPVVGADDLDVDGGCSTQGAQTATLWVWAGLLGFMVLFRRRRACM
ncbi:MAG: hypothetical protein KTR25_16525, partial [Myxococcales bacterium]|nr:hypothetical protein [Myxococcales bacterium]